MRDVNYPTLESSWIQRYLLRSKNRYKLANEEDAQSGLALVEEQNFYIITKKTWFLCPSLLYVMTELLDEYIEKKEPRFLHFF